MLEGLYCSHEHNPFGQILQWIERYWHEKIFIDKIDRKTKNIWDEFKENVLSKCKKSKQKNCQSEKASFEFYFFNNEAFVG